MTLSVVRNMLKYNKRWEVDKIGILQAQTKLGAK